MDHACVSDKCIVKIVRDKEVVENVIDSEYEKEKEQVSIFLAKEFIKIILNKGGESKGEKNETKR